MGEAVLLVVLVSPSEQLRLLLHWQSWQSLSSGDRHSCRPEMVLTPRVWHRWPIILNYRHPCETVHMQDKILVVGGEDRNQFCSRSLEDRKECLEWTVQIHLDATVLSKPSSHHKYSTVSVRQSSTEWIYSGFGHATGRRFEILQHFSNTTFSVHSLLCLCKEIKWIQRKVTDNLEYWTDEWVEVWI